MLAEIFWGTLPGRSQLHVAMWPLQNEPWVFSPPLLGGCEATAREAQTGLFPFPVAPEGPLGRVVFKSVSPGDVAWEGDASIGSLPSGESARGGQAGTERWDLVTSDSSLLLFPLSLKGTDLQTRSGRDVVQVALLSPQGPVTSLGALAVPSQLSSCYIA